ncbi:TetR/AcrR family transcriptional regulator [Streptomyces sp. NPDC059740]|uniref:TetR/AcrR family transcriptional regulator n=1 Tax=Streptomyces sp. NPDC059740 TaxID=3346926 RepID=UPI0036587ED6
MPSVTDEPSRPAPFREPQQARSRATLMRVLQAAEDLLVSEGIEELTMTGVAERAGVSVGSIYRRFEGKDQLVVALQERIRERLEENLAGRLRTAQPSLEGVVEAYTHALAQSFAAKSRVFAALLPARGTDVMDRGFRVVAVLHRLLREAAEPHLGEIRRTDPRSALDAMARTLIGACVHTAARSDRPADEAGWDWYADQLSDMALAYLRTPDRRAGPQPPAAG